MQRDCCCATSHTLAPGYPSSCTVGRASMLCSYPSTGFRWVLPVRSWVKYCGEPSWRPTGPWAIPSSSDSCVQNSALSRCRFDAAEQLIKGVQNAFTSVLHGPDFQGSVAKQVGFTLVNFASCLCSLDGMLCSLNIRGHGGIIENNIDVWHPHPVACSPQPGLS